MFSGFLTVFQFIWPFLKEALFGNASFRAWAKLNYLSILWFVMMLIMLLIVIAMSNMLNKTEQDLEAQLSASSTLMKANTTYKATNDLLQKQVDEYRLKASKKKPDAPHSSPTAPHRPPASKAVQDENQSLLERLKRH